MKNELMLQTGFFDIELKNNTFAFGGDQDFYPTEWQKKSGCGPTTASNMFAYLSFYQDNCKALCDIAPPFTKDSFTRHMEVLWHYITPTSKGVNTTEIFTDGATAYAKDRGIDIQCRTLNINALGQRPSYETYKQFLFDGLNAGCPIAFLNLSNGKLENLHHWHWVTLVGIRENDKGEVFALASDEGEKKEFDMKLWLETTRLGGGLVYFTFKNSAVQV